MSVEIKHKLLSSEKSFIVRNSNKLVLLTRSYIQKKEIIAFIEQKYDVKVLKINSLILKGKIKVRRRHKVQLPDRKKFYITLDSLKKFEKIEKKNAEEV